MIEAANTERSRADAQIGTESKRKKSVRKFGGREAGVLWRSAFK
jgi:hypothetical protein